MIPKPTEESKKLFKHQIKFTLFKKEFEFTVQVLQQE